MSVQLILGGCGSGKTQTMIGQVCAQAARRPDQHIFVIVPEQATASMQRALVTASGRSGILSIDVVSFARLAHRVFEEQGALGRIILDDVGKNLLLRHAFSACADQLICLGSSVGRPGTISEIKSILSEFMQYGIGEDDLGDLISELAGSDNSLSDKLRDLRTLYAAFRQSMGDRYLTKEEQLSVLASLVPSSGILAGSVIALDGFTGLTPVQRELMTQLAGVCERVIVTVTLPAEEESAYRDPYELFGMSKRFCRQMTDIAEKAGCGFEEPVVLERRTDGKSGIISFVEQHIFRHPEAAAGGGQADELQIFSCANRREECALAAKKALELLHEHDWHYRDIAVILCDMEGYADPVTEAFANAGLPHFLDYKHHVMDNAFVEYVRSFLEIEISDYAAGEVMRFLRTGFGPLDMDQTDRLDNVVTARGYHGYARWSEPWDEEDESRASLVERLADLHALAGSEQTVTVWTQTLYRFLEKDGALTALRRLAGQFGEDGESERAQEYGRVYSGLIHLMDELTELTGDEVVPLREYARMLDAGLEEVKVGVLPDTRDHILIGDLTRTRLADVRAVLIIGAGSEHLPGDTVRKGLLTRWDRETFASAGLELSPGAKEQTYSQQFYLYQILSKPTDCLAVIFPRTTAKGDPEEPSYLVRELTGLTGAEVLAGSEYLDEPRGISPRYGLDYLFRHVQERISGAGTAQSADLWRGIAHVMGRDARCEGAMRVLREAASCRHHAAWLSDAATADLYGEGRRRSISQLQKYAECPYKHFLTYGLKLQERDVYEFKVSDFGSVFHAAIERYGRRVQEAGLRWQDVSGQTRREWVAQVTEEAAADCGYEILHNEARHAYRLEQIGRLMERSVDVITEQLEAGAFEPSAYELNFGSGIIDRLDLAETDDGIYVKVLDYKTGSQEMDLNKEYHGLQIQLPVYMAEAVDLIERDTDKEVIPAALFYYTVDDPFVEIGPGESAEDAVREKLRVDGVIRDDQAVYEALDRALPGKSLAAPFGITGGGTARRTKRILSPGDMDAVVAFGRRKAEQMNRRIEEGRIEVSPYKLDQARGCQYCPYQAICHFDARIEGYRVLEKMKDDEALERMRGEVGS